MNDRRVDAEMLVAWLAGRSLARGLPAPVADRGGFRVDTRSNAEVARWVFPQVGDGLRQLASEIDRPGYLLKLCGPPADLRAAVSPAWTIGAPAYFMTGTSAPPRAPLPLGYRIVVERDGAVVAARIVSDADGIAASGFAAEAGGAFVYDRIITEPAHRRRGLARALLRALHDARACSDAAALLVATQAGRGLYATLGWETLSLYSTASIAVSSACGSPAS